MIKINIDELNKEYRHLLIKRGPIIAGFILVLFLNFILIPIAIHQSIMVDPLIALISIPFILLLYLMYFMYNSLVTLQGKKSNLIIRSQSNKHYTKLEKYLLADSWKGYIEGLNTFFKAIGFPIDYIGSVPFFKKIISSFFYLFSILLYASALSSIVTQSKILDAPDKLFYLIAYLTSFFIILIIATLFRNLARYTIRISVNQQKEKDKRKPIVYLRAFEEDNFFLNQNIFIKFILYLQGKTKLDPIMLEECSTIGPVIALGDPKEETSPYGPPRYYAKDEEWKSYVQSILNDARYIYMFLQGTNGVKWEVAQLIKMNKLQETIFIVSPNSLTTDILEYFDIIIKNISTTLEKIQIEEIRNKIIKKEIIAFFLSNEKELVVLEGIERAWMTYFFSIRASLRLKVAFDEKLFTSSEMKSILAPKREILISKEKIRKNQIILLTIAIIVGGFFYIKNQAITLHEELEIINTNIRENAIYQIYLERDSAEKILIDTEIERLMTLKKEKKNSLKWISWSIFLNKENYNEPQKLEQ